MKVVRIILLICLSVYNSSRADDSCHKNSDYMIVRRGNLISLRKIDNEYNKMLLNDPGGGFERFLDVVFNGIVEFEKGRRRKDFKSLST